MEVKVTLRAKNQLTLPEPVVKRLGIGPGDDLVVQLDERQGIVRLRPLRRSYAGIAAGLYGTAEEARAYVEGERASWEADEPGQP